MKRIISAITALLLTAALCLPALAADTQRAYTVYIGDSEYVFSQGSDLTAEQMNEIARALHDGEVGKVSPAQKACSHVYSPTSELRRTSHMSYPIEPRCMVTVYDVRVCMLCQHIDIHATMVYRIYCC